jgi:hypothetical protein
MGASLLAYSEHERRHQILNFFKWRLCVAASCLAGKSNNEQGVLAYALVHGLDASMMHEK